MPWRGVVSLGIVAMLAGAGGLGKSMSLVQLAVAILTGGRWFGSPGTLRSGVRIDSGGWQVATPGPVILLLGEEDRHEAHRRIVVAVGAGRTTDEIDAIIGGLLIVPFAGRGALPLLTDREGSPTRAAAHLRDLVEEVKPVAVLVDPAVRFAGPGTEADNDLATSFISCLESLTSCASTPTVVLAHHTSQTDRQSKGGGQDATAARGVTGLTDAVRWVGSLRPGDGGCLALRVVKSNYAAFPEPLTLRRDRGGLLIDASAPPPSERLSEGLNV